jgi:RND family efflux transporter MFP subunit
VKRALRSLAASVVGIAGIGIGASVSAAEFDCMIEPAQIVEVRSPVVGIVQHVHARRGDAVRKGDLLVTIESSVEQSAADAARFRSQAQGGLLLARHKVDAAAEKLRRMEQLHEQEYVSNQARDDAAAELRLAQAELKSAEESSELAKLEYRQSIDHVNRRALRSPFDGVVMDQYLYPGAMVDGGEGKKPILKIAQTDPLIVQAILPFQYFPRVKPGHPAIVTPELPFTRKIAARVKAVDRVVDSAAGTFGVIAELANPAQSLPGGIRCKLELTKTAPDASVPDSKARRRP